MHTADEAIAHRLQERWTDHFTCQNVLSETNQRCRSIRRVGKYCQSRALKKMDIKDKKKKKIALPEDNDHAMNVLLTVWEKKNKTKVDIKEVRDILRMLKKAKTNARNVNCPASRYVHNRVVEVGSSALASPEQKLAMEHSLEQLKKIVDRNCCATVLDETGERCPNFMLSGMTYCLPCSRERGDPGLYNPRKRWPSSPRPRHTVANIRSHREDRKAVGERAENAEGRVVCSLSSAPPVIKIFSREKSRSWKSPWC